MDRAAHLGKVIIVLFSLSSLFLGDWLSVYPKKLSEWFGCPDFGFLMLSAVSLADFFCRYSFQKSPRSEDCTSFRRSQQVFLVWVSKFFVPKDTKDGVWKSIACHKNWTVYIWKCTFKFASLVAGITFSQSISQDISKVPGIWIARTDAFSLIRAISRCLKEQLE